MESCFLTSGDLGSLGSLLTLGRNAPKSAGRRLTPDVPGKQELENMFTKIAK